MTSCFISSNCIENSISSHYRLFYTNLHIIICNRIIMSFTPPYSDLGKDASQSKGE